jgi:hypothetical protein
MPQKFHFGLGLTVQVSTKNFAKNNVTLSADFMKVLAKNL